MNKALRGRAENVILLQEYGVMTDTQTLKASTIIAHHDKQFQVADERWHSYFNDLARMFREKFPQCPCRACNKNPTNES